MRVTDAMSFALAQRYVSRARSRAATAQEQASSGKRVLKPSDDPVATDLAVREQSREKNADARVRAVNAGLTALTTADQTLDEINEGLQSVRELALQGANSTFDAEQRASAAKEVSRIYQQVIGLGNTQADGRYIFAGYRDDVAPFTGAGAYVGDGSVRELEVAPGVRLPTGVSGNTVFGVGSGVDVLATIDTVRQALETSDAASLRQALSDLDTATSQIANARSDVGASLNAFDAAKAIAERDHDQSVSRQTELVGADPFDSYLELTRAQSALAAAVRMAAQLPLASLIGEGR